MTPVADWLNENGHEARIVMGEQYDTFGLTSRSKHARMVPEGASFYDALRDEVDALQPTHIHVNGSLNGLTVARAEAPYAPSVFQYHGGDVRGRNYIHLRVRLLADKVIVSTKDLDIYGEWYGCPVEKRFQYQGGREEGTALIILPPTIHFDFSRQAKEYARRHGLKLTIVDCTKGERIPSEEMPEFLSKFEYYLDFKGVRKAGTLSKAAMEAFAIGCKVVHDSDLNHVITEYGIRTPQDYLNLYRSQRRPSLAKTAARLAFAIPRSRML